MKFKIDGYENMTAEEKLAALEAYEPDMSGFVRKDLLDKANSEAASYKKQLREKMSADEQAQAQQAEAMKSMQDELAALRQEKAVGDLTKRWMGLGYSEELATATAKAMTEGNMDVVFKNHAAFVAEREKSLKAELLKQTPTPVPGASSAGITKDKFDKLSLIEKQKFATENPEIYNNFYK